MVRLALCSVMLACAVACQASTFVCQTDVQCGSDGVCEANGSCSFPDDGCESGRRYGMHGAQPGVCVPLEEGGTADPETTSSSATMTGLSTSSSTTEDGDSTTMMVATSASVTSDASTSTGMASESSESTGGPIATFDFEDDFERADSDEVGNGWVEKTPDAISLVNGGLRRTALPMSAYQNNLVYRPDQSWQDAEAVLSLTFDLVDPWGFPQFVLRTQPDDIDLPASVTGYLLFVEDSGILQVTRQIAGEFTFERVSDLTGPIVPGTPYRMRLRVMGTDPVMVDGYLEEFVDGGWVVHTEVHMIDDEVDRITAPGTLALGGHVTLERWTYEHVGVYDLGP